MSRFYPLCAVVLAGCSISHGTPSREVIEANADSSADVYGHYAVVKLPLNDGVVVWNPTQIEPGPDGLMYVANKGGEIYSLHDSDGDGLEDTSVLFCDVGDDGLLSPTSLTFHDGELFVGTAQAIRAYRDNDGDGSADESRVIFDDIPYSEHPYEYTSALTFTEDGSLYFSLTTDSWNAGASPDPDGIRGAIMRLAPDADEPVRFATGTRSVPGMAVGPAGEIFFVDNQGGGNPTEELNVATRGAFYGHNPVKYDSPAVTDPLYSFQTEVAPGGITFGPDGDLYVALYGPGERWQRGGVARIHFDRADDGSIRAEEIPVATGLAKLSDVAFGASGDLYVTQMGKTDYWYQSLEERDGAIYRLIEVPWVAGLPPDSARARPAPVAPDAAARGEQLFAERACSACHAVDGTTEWLGPNLKGIAQIYSREELLEEIREPSKRIKPSMMSTRITKTDGTVLLGRVVASDEDQVSVIGIGNVVTQVPRADIAQTEDVSQSMMYPGLLYGLTDEQVDDLLAYLSSI